MDADKTWLRQLIAWLMPKQTNSGADALQVGRAGGHVNSGSGSVQTGAVGGSVLNVTQVHHHFYAPQPTAVPPVVDQQATAEHKEVLALMDPLPGKNRKDVLAFMQREFSTTMVIRLKPNEVYRVKMYVLKVRQSQGIGNPS